MSAEVEEWQEYDCPNSLIDFDLYGVSMVAEGESFYCSGCGKTHIATPELITQYSLVPGGELAIVPLCKQLTA